MTAAPDQRAPAVALTPMAHGDLPDVEAIEAAAYPRPWPSAIFVTELGRDDRTYLVARRDGTVVGFAGASVGAGEAHVLTVAVHPNHRRQGIARRLLDALIDAVAEQGAGAVTLEVRENNHGARSLYRARGFEEAGVRPHYYRDTDEGAVIMWLKEL